MIRSISLKQLLYVPQLFYRHDTSGNLSVVAVKIVDDVLFVGDENLINSIMEMIQSNSELGAVVYGPRSFLFFCLEICQDSGYSITFNADTKIYSLELYPLSRPRRKDCDDILNAVETSSFTSVNSSLGW